jgi:hypothetical protein
MDRMCGFDAALRPASDKSWRGFPSALDLLVVCVEAGLSLDVALNRVAHEMARMHRELSQDLASVMRRTAKRAIEARRVSSRGAQRMQVEEVHGFMAVDHSDGTVRHQHRPGVADSCRWVTNPTGPASHRDRVPIAGETALSAHLFHFSRALRHPPGAGGDSRPSPSQRCGCSLIGEKRPSEFSDVLAHIIHERFYCNRRSAAATSLRPAGSPLRFGRLTNSAARTDVARFSHRAVRPSTYCTSTHRGRLAPRAGLSTRVSALPARCPNSPSSKAAARSATPSL